MLEGFRSVRGLTWVMAVAGILVLGGCAAGPKPGAALAPEDAQRLAAVGAVRVESNDRGVRREAEVALSREGGPAVTQDPKATAVLKVEASCGSDFDYWRPPPLINEPGSGIDDSAKEHRGAHSPGSSRACDVRADFLLDKRVLWTETLHSGNLSAGELISLSNALVAKFAKVWKEARTPQAPSP